MGICKRSGTQQSATILNNGWYKVLVLIKVVFCNFTIPGLYDEDTNAIILERCEVPSESKGATYHLKFTGYITQEN